jgi:dTDP-4-dehydrorhamnose reductase
MIVLYGSSGFIGSHIVKELCAESKHNFSFMCSKTRIWNYDSIYKELKLYKPTSVINAAGYPTPNNIDFYEENTENKSNLLLTNTAGNLILADICNKLKIHYVVIMSGCIYNSYKYNTNKQYQNTTKYIRTFNEKSKPNFQESLYSKNRVMTEELLSIYTNICILRIRMPVSSFMNDKSLINKLIKYPNVTNIPNSISILDDCIKKIPNILKLKKTGIVNLVNDGVVTNAFICKLYKKYVNQNHTFNIVSLDYLENKNKDKPKRSNCILRPSKCINPIPNAEDSLLLIFKKFKKTIDIYC